MIIFRSLLLILLITAGCSDNNSIPEGFDVEGWLTSVADGDLDAVKSGLDQGISPMIRRADGLTALQIAVKQGKLEIARALIEAGADVNDTGQEGLSPLIYAIYLDDAEMVKLLMGFGVRLEGHTRYAMDPLTLAFTRRDMRVISELAMGDVGDASAHQKVRQWIDEQSEDTELSGDLGDKLLYLRGILALNEAGNPESALEAEEKLLHLAGLKGDRSLDAAYTLMKTYSDPNSLLFNLSKAQQLIEKYYFSRSKSEAIFFSKLAASGREPLAEFLYGRALRTGGISSYEITGNISVYDEDHPGSRLILRSAQAGNVFAQADLGDKYDEYFRHSNEKIRDEKIAWLQRAAEAGVSKAAYKLASLYVVGVWVHRDLEKALFWFNRSGELGDCSVYRTVGYNFQRGIEVFPEDQAQAVEWYRKGAQCGDPEAMTTLAKAYEEGTMGLPMDYLQAVKYYLPNLEYQEKSTMLASTGLTWAVQEGNAGLVGQWLAMLPRDSPAGRDGWLAAAESNNPAIAGLFLEAGVDVRGTQGIQVAQIMQVANKDQTALMIAAVHGHLEMTAWLLEHGSDINQSNSFGFTALSLAAGRGFLDIVELLLNNGAAVEVAAGSPVPLVQAMRGGHHEVVRLLLDKDAKLPSIKSAEGQKLLTFIRQKKDRQMERILLDTFEK
jgi:ankyrin repeat protein